MAGKSKWARAAPGKAKPKLTEKAAKDIEALKMRLRHCKMETPDSWPSNIVKNPQCLLKLPEGWHYGKKITGSSGRGSGGKLLPVFVGPADPDTGKPRVFFHRVTLEKHLGYKLDQSDDFKRMRLRDPEALKMYPEGAVLKKTENTPHAEYIKARCERLDGMTLTEALDKSEYECDGKNCQYNMADFKYDKLRGFLTVCTANGELVAGASSPAPKAARKAPSCRAKAAAKKPHRLRVPLSRAASSSSTTPRCEASAAAPVTTTAAPGLLRHIHATVRSAWMGILARILIGGEGQGGMSGHEAKVFAPLTKAAASAVADGEKDIFTLIGVGHQLGMDPVMLKMLPEVLRKPPASRGEFGNMAVEHFERDLKKHR